MKQFYLTIAAAMVVAVSLASNLLWVLASASKTAGVRSRLQSALGGLRDLIDVSVAAGIARGERQAAFSTLEHFSDVDPGDVGTCRDRSRLVLPGRDRALH